MVVLTAVSAALFAAILIPFKILPIIPGVTEIRPANAIPMVMSLLFGPAGAWGSSFGNLVGDFFLGLGPGSVFGMIGNFLYGFAPYALWRTLFRDRMPDRARAGDWVALMAIFLVAGSACAFTIGWGIDVVIGGVPFAILGSIIFFNNVVMSVILAPPLLFALLPRVRAWGLLYTQILPEKAVRRPRFAWLGAILFTVGSVGGLGYGMAVATGRYAQPVGIPQFWKALTKLAAPGTAAPPASATALTGSVARVPTGTAVATPAPKPVAPPPAPHRAGLGMALAPMLVLIALGVLLL